MPKLIIIAGPPGSGKSSVAKLLSEKLKAPYIDFGRLREFHLDREWKNQGPEEEELTSENLVFIIRNYFQHGYQNVIVDDLRDPRVERLAKTFPESIIFTLLPSDEELQQRITSRDLGWKNVASAIEWNRQCKDRDPFPNEHRLDNSNESPTQTVDRIIKSL